MNKRIKVAVLLFLASLCVILASAILALVFIRGQRQTLLELKQKTNPAKSKRSSNGNKLPPFMKTKRSDHIPDQLTELRMNKYRKAPDSNDFATIAEAYLGKALRLIPFERNIRTYEGVMDIERTSYDDETESSIVEAGSSMDGNAIPSKLYYSNFNQESGGSTRIADGNDDKLKDNSKPHGDRKRIGILGWIRRMIQILIETYDQHNIYNEGHEDEFYNSTTRFQEEKEAMYYLEQAAEMGNSDAQNIIANALVSGILPVGNSPELRRYLGSENKKKQQQDLKQHSSMEQLKVSSDFSEGDDQLARGLMLWHLSAMDGNIESAMAMGYRHLYSAKMGNTLDNSEVIPDEAVKRSLESSRNLVYDESSTGSYNKRSRIKHIHNPTSSEHYGVLGTCESALTYYEAAASAIMDELESSPLRAKVSPAIDQHHLAEIHQRGASSALEHHNKPDELDEALKYYAMRASRKNPEPDINSAYKLATYYHYGLNGVKQDMRLALKYYEIAADFHSWEAAGQAGKFHLWMMGVNKDERNLKKAHRYFGMGMPGGLAGCKRRLKAKAQMKKKKTDDFWDDAFFEKDTQCDHPCVNGMGLLHLFGVPYLVDVNVTLAIEHFTVAQNLGNMDAIYNLGMMRLGWMNSKYGKAFDKHSGKSSRPTGPNVADYKEALSLFTRASQMGHMQAKFRLASLYARGVRMRLSHESPSMIQAIPKSCTKALSHYKEIADTGTTISQRMRVAYKQYTSGDYDSSLRNYIAAAETGSVVAQVNAAFLMEEGHCLGMERPDCLKASVRMWRAAARQGNEEACLRVGDFYYYGRLRNKPGTLDKSLERETDFSLAPFPWIRYILYPEDFVSLVLLQCLNGISWFAFKAMSDSSIDMVETSFNEDFDVTAVESCSAEEEGTCDNFTDDFDFDEELESEHLSIAAHYYRRAAEKHESARANFNLGFMHEWGLGLSQDFPLAKRHYDLAAKQKGGEGLIAVQIALFCMDIHEKGVKLRHNMVEWLNDRQNDDVFNMAKPWLKFIIGSQDMDVLKAGGKLNQMKASVIVKSLIWSWETFAILALLFVLMKLIDRRRNGR